MALVARYSTRVRLTFCIENLKKKFEEKVLSLQANSFSLRQNKNFFSITRVFKVFQGPDSGPRITENHEGKYL